MKNHRIIKVFVLLVCITASTKADITFYTNETDWLAAVGLVETFELNSTNLATADQVIVPPEMYPGSPTNLGSVLTFMKDNTGLSSSFELRTVQSGAEFVYNDNQLNPTFWNKLAVGKQNIHEDDDWELEIFQDSSPAIYGFAVDVIDNDTIEAGEEFRVYDENSTLLGSLAIETFAEYTFFGVVSSNPIGSISFNEAAGDDDICLDKVHFAVVPAPGALVLSSIGLVFSGWKLRRRRIL